MIPWGDGRVGKTGGRSKISLNKKKKNFFEKPGRRNNTKE